MLATTTGAAGDAVSTASPQGEPMSDLSPAVSADDVARLTTAAAQLDVRPRGERWTHLTLVRDRRGLVNQRLLPRRDGSDMPPLRHLRRTARPAATDRPRGRRDRYRPREPHWTSWSPTSNDAGSSGSPSRPATSNGPAPTGTVASARPRLCCATPRT